MDKKLFIHRPHFKRQKLKSGVQGRYFPRFCHISVVKIYCFSGCETTSLPRKPEGPVLVVMDGYSSHCNSVETLQLWEENNVQILRLPSHMTHYLQPLDRTFFKAFRCYHYSAYNSYLKINPSRKISRLIFGQLLLKSWLKMHCQVSEALELFHLIRVLSRIMLFWFDLWKCHWRTKKPTIALTRVS